MASLKTYSLLVLLGLCAAAGLQGCFTGVESTPPITAQDVKRSNATPSAEALYTSHILPLQPARWQAGKEFVVTDTARLHLVMTPPEMVSRLHPGDTLRFVGFAAIPAAVGEEDTGVILTTPASDTICYRLAKPLEAVAEMEELQIPFTVELSLVEALGRLMEGGRYWITSSVWFDPAGGNITGRRLVGVTVDKVTVGNGNYPARVWFTDDKGVRSSVFMSVGEGTRGLRNFESLFSLTDPRPRYRDITNDVWDAITRGQVKPMMTRRECRLALGNPREVLRGHYIERWNYENGLSLIFDDDRLVRIGN